jgi:NADH-quinone oxidoreductase subunit M
LKLLFMGVIASATFLWLTHHLARVTTDVVALDGSRSDMAFLLQDASRELLHGHAIAGDLLGLPIVRGLAVLAIVCAGALSFAAPFHRLGADLAAELDAAPAAVIVAMSSLAGAFVLLRFGVLLSPEAARWASPGLAILGLVTIVAAVASAATTTDLRRLAGVLPSAAAGALFVAASSLTPQGTQGAIAIAVSRPLAAALLVLLAGALVSRTGDADLSRWGGFGRQAPRLAGALVVALAASAGLPGGASFWGAWLGLLGSVGRAPAIGALFAIGLVATAMVHARLWPLIAGRPDPGWERSAALEPFGGTVPDLRAGGERAWAFVLLAPLVLLTLTPRSWLGVSNQLVLDVLPYVDPPGPTQVAETAPPVETARLRG